MAVLMALLPAAGHDQLWCLYVADRMLHGVRLYGPELLESNPPLIMWLLLPVTGLAHAIHLPATVLFKAAVLLTVAGSALACSRLLRPTFPSPATLWSLLFVWIVVFCVMPARDFGQRDHLLAVLCVPYLVAASLRLRQSLSTSDLSVDSPRPFAGLWIGVAAGVGIALKPHHALVPVFVESLLILRRRSLRPLQRPEPWAILLTCLLYLLAIRIVTPTYLTEILPILRSTYWAIGPLKLTGLIAEAIQLHVLILITVAVFVVRSRSMRTSSPLTEVLLAAGVASTLAYDLQGTGWYYQQLPALSFFTLALACQLGSMLPARRPTPRWLPMAAAALGVLAIALTTHFMDYPFTPDRSFPITSPDPTFFAGLAPGTPVAILTTMVDDSVPPVAKYHLLWAQRTNNLWILPAILRNEAPEGKQPLRTIPQPRLAELDRGQHRWMVEDLERWQPPLVLVQRCQDPAVHCQILEDRHDNLLAWFRRDPGFRTLWREHYRFVRSSGEFDAYIRQ